MKYILVVLTGTAIGWVICANGISLVNPWLLIIITAVVAIGAIIWILTNLLPRWPG